MRGRELVRAVEVNVKKRGGRTAQALPGGKGPAHERDKESGMMNHDETK
jgi:hypothetical protein